MLGILAAVVVFGYLAGAAGEFGALAFGGQAMAWIFTGASVLGALACVLVIVVLVVRCLRALGFIREYKPRRASSRHAERR